MTDYIGTSPQIHQVRLLEPAAHHQTVTRIIPPLYPTIYLHMRTDWPLPTLITIPSLNLNHLERSTECASPIHRRDSAE